MQGADQTVAARLADERSVLNQRTDDLLDKEGVPARPLLHETEQRSQREVHPQKPAQQLAHGRVGQRRNR